jgi:hypothetical protein
MEDAVRPSEPELSEASPHRALGPCYQGPAGGLLCDALCFGHSRTARTVDNDLATHLYSASLLIDFNYQEHTYRGDMQRNIYTTALDPPEASTEPILAEQAAEPKRPGPTRRLPIWWMCFQNLALNFCPQSDVLGSYLLPLQIAAFSAAGSKNTNLGLATAVGAVAQMGQPVFGLISDRSRSRFGRRRLHIVLSSLVRRRKPLGEGGDVIMSYHPVCFLRRTANELHRGA